MYYLCHAYTFKGRHLYTHNNDYINIWLDVQKLSQIAQELKSNLKPNINDTLMHCPEASTMWL